MATSDDGVVNPNPNHGSADVVSAKDYVCGSARQHDVDRLHPGEQPVEAEQHDPFIQESENFGYDDGGDIGDACEVLTIVSE